MAPSNKRQENLCYVIDAVALAAAPPASASPIAAVTADNIDNVNLVLD